MLNVLSSSSDYWTLNIWVFTYKVKQEPYLMCKKGGMGVSSCTLVEKIKVNVLF